MKMANVFQSLEPSQNPFESYTSRAGNGEID
jgi:hypothetical protein